MKFVETKESREATAKKQCYVWRARNGEKRGTWYAWRVESVDAAKSMVAWWHAREPREYPSTDEWAVTQGEYGPVIANFTTREAAEC